MRRALETILGVFFCVTVLPARVITDNALFATKLLLFQIAGAKELITRIRLLMPKQGLVKQLNLLLTYFLIAPPMALLLALSLPVTGMVLLLLMLIEALQGMGIGLIYTLHSGLDGFVKAWLEHKFFAGKLSHHLDSFFDPDHVLPEFNHFAGLGQLIAREQSVPEAINKRKMANLQRPSPGSIPNLLNSDEQHDLEELLKLAEAEDNTSALSASKKEQCNALKIRLEQYTCLVSKLTRLQAALVNNDLSAIEDEIIVCNEIEKPILFVKQYQIDGTWRNVPGCSYISDHDKLSRWFTAHLIHPLNNDVIDKPLAYKERPTRYVWYPLTAERCSSQELGEAADEVRDLAAKVSGKSWRPPKAGSWYQCYLQFFSANAPGQEAPAHCDNHNARL